MGAQSNKGQVAALNCQKPGGDNYNNWQGQRGSSGSLPQRIVWMVNTTWNPLGQNRCVVKTSILLKQLNKPNNKEQGIAEYM